MNEKLRKILSQYIDMPDELIEVIREIEQVFVLTDKEQLQESGY